MLSCCMDAGRAHGISLTVRDGPLLQMRWASPCWRRSSAAQIIRKEGSIGFAPLTAHAILGEALSIRQMIDWMISEHGLDRKHVYVTGLSAGGAMTSVLLATYPEVFAGGAVIAGLPFGVATNFVGAIALMKGKLERSSGQLGDEVRAASPHHGPWPKVSIWQGDVDTIVAASNADAITRQWCDVHGLRDDEALQSQVSGQTRRFWRDASGREVLETFIIPKMGHAVPVSGKGGQGSGALPPFFEDTGISSASQIAKFWGLSTSPTSKQALRRMLAHLHRARLRDYADAYQMLARKRRRGLPCGRRLLSVAGSCMVFAVRAKLFPRTMIRSPL